MSRTPDFGAAAAAGIITGDQADRLSEFFSANAHLSAPQQPVSEAATARSGARFDLANLLWYLGALIIIGAMGMFQTLAFAGLGAGALLVTALIYAAAFVFAGDYLWRRKGLKTPGGLLIAVAVGMAPMAVYSIQELAGAWGVVGDPGKYKDFYVYVRGGWLPMEAVTLIVALIAIRFYPFGFITMIAALMLWFMSMDLTPWVGRVTDDSWGLRAIVSMWFGLGLIVFAWFVDIKQRKADYAFWLHLAGIAAFWGGLTFQSSDSELSKFLYCLLNLGLMGFAVFLARRVYAVFGAIGVCIYLGYISAKLFKDSLMFPFALSAMGLAVIALGLLYHRNSTKIADAFEEFIPEPLKRLRPAAARS
ncbi:hypothetical protein [Terrarubrum flagellatum]|uniref:hypothetical protein n=1 Tax=Terrirubrum flagellatum TaxID=2895980 RepID=UPI0031455B4D